MAKQHTNSEGLTYREWYLAAGYAGKPSGLGPKMAWLDGEDPSEHRASGLGAYDIKLTHHIAEILATGQYQARKGDFFAAGSAYEAAVKLSWQVYDTDARCKAQALAYAFLNVALRLQEDARCRP